MRIFLFSFLLDFEAKIRRKFPKKKKPQPLRVAAYKFI